MAGSKQCQGMTHEGQQCARRVAHPPHFCPDHRDQAPVVGQVGLDGTVQRLAVEQREVHGRLAPKSRESASPLQDALVDADAAQEADESGDPLPGV